jgi:hypothetical protein
MIPFSEIANSDSLTIEKRRAKKIRLRSLPVIVLTKQVVEGQVFGRRSKSKPFPTRGEGSYHFSRAQILQGTGVKSADAPRKPTPN